MVDIMTALATASQAIKLAQDLRGIDTLDWRSCGCSDFLDRAPDEKLFRFHIGGRLRNMLALAMKRAGLKFQPRQGGFHLFCHTYGTWMTRYGDLDTYGLVRTQRWKDPVAGSKHKFAAP